TLRPDRLNQVETGQLLRRRRRGARDDGAAHPRRRLRPDLRGRSRQRADTRTADESDVRDRAVGARVLPGCGARRVLAQCLKCRRPVSTIVAPAARTVSVTSASRFDPPGWMTALTPASRASRGPSGNGKNASDARTAPFTSWPCARALSSAILTASTREV